MASKISKCCKPFLNTRCSKNLRKVTEKVIDKLKSLECNIPLDTSLFICDSCRLIKQVTVKVYGDVQSVEERSVAEQQQPLPEPRPPVAEPNPPVAEPIAPVAEPNPPVAEPQPSGSRNYLEEVPSATSVASASSQESVTPDYSIAYSVEMLNTGIAGINVSPVSIRKLKNAAYPKRKYLDIQQGLRKHIFGFEADEDLDQLKRKAANFDEMISQLQEKFTDTGCSRDDKLRVLSVLPKSWNNQEVMQYFDVPLYLIRQARNLTEEKGILSTMNDRIGHGLDAEVKNEVQQFFDNDLVSRAMPGQNDFVSVKKDGKRQHVQKRLLLCSLREAYTTYKEISKNIVGFSSFAALRPNHCKLLGSSGSHNICVCTIHENVELMIHVLKKYSFDNDSNLFMDKILCSTSTRSKYCYLRECERCPTRLDFEKQFLKQLEECSLTEITFEQWISTDRCNLETLIQQVDEFVLYFCEKLEKLVAHNYIKNEQSKFLRHTKSNLNNGEVVVVCDFSENYSFVLQDAAQSSYWNNDQATIHPFVIYYSESGTLRNLSFIVISEVLKHDTIAVQVFISKLMDFLKSRLEIKKALFMSDGAASQYKNRKNFASLCKYKSKYNIDAEWHFFATSHGKGPCDAIGGTLKRMARNASVSAEHEHPIKNAEELYNWAKQRSNDFLTKMSFCYVSQEDYEQGVTEWSNIFQQTKMITGTQKYHSFVPISENRIAAKLFSNDNTSSTHNVYKNKTNKLII